MTNGQIPVIVVEALNLPEAWEKMAIQVFQRGTWIKTPFDEEGEKPSLDCTGIVKVINPMTEPRIHKNIQNSYEGLIIYAENFIHGFQNHLSKFFTYMYSQRFHQYFGINQFDLLIHKVIEKPLSRQNQMCTWDPNKDFNPEYPQSEGPPCLQRIWVRLLENDAGQLILNMNTHWRSRDLWKAWFENAFAAVSLQAYLAKTISERLGKSVAPGRYVDVSDSLHIYGRDQNEEEIKKMLTRSYLSRSISSKDPVFLGEKASAMAKIEVFKEAEERAEFQRLQALSLEVEASAKEDIERVVKDEDKKKEETRGKVEGEKAETKKEESPKVETVVRKSTKKRSDKGTTKPKSQTQKSRTPKKDTKEKNE